MKKNKIGKLLLLVATTSFLGSCDLTVTPTDRYDQESFWLGAKTAQAGLVGCYSALSNQYLYGNASVLWEESASPNAYNYDNRLGWNNVSLGTHTADIALVNGRWSAAYTGIGRCNALLDNIDGNLELTPSQIAQMKAEARFLRALFYHLLISYYGDVPLITAEADIAQGSLPRTKREEVAQFIVRELDEIAPALPIRYLDNADFGRPTRGAALSLKAKVLLFEASPLFNADDSREKWRQAADAAKSVIDLGVYSLYPNYRTLFSAAAENGSESIFDIQFNNEPNRGSSFDVTIRQYGNAAPLLDLVQSYVMVDGKPKEESAYSESDTYENRDPRFKQTIVYPGSTFLGEIVRNDGNNTNFKVVQTGFAFKKYSIYDAGTATTAQIQIGDNMSEINYMVLRYADILMMYAEAKNELGELSEDVWNMTVRPIRQRAGFSLQSVLDYPGSNPSKLRELIRYERRIEFAGEGYYYNDVRRWRTAENVLSGTIRKHDGTPIITRTFDAARDYWWPISTTQMELNPNLRPNNPGWGQ
ncbi:RagB/SusD family nutrient uptake outer membrane protein [Sphingobacterium gobiense]|uniref:RagB/SusD family nutrient uptake outer membrane protein n=1 Tax=Sphingobacterium gobiense TaxID=1382456 RepID=A0A2S9JS51_9SPHI|nr:RagB/SusD family nutrient uptake outer membrane protein [Sphingobacterium gobiense]PRD56080.1 RagB/SusD family nutrient uptake outer membrane protein [Sphingobacterium gobiense]